MSLQVRAHKLMDTRFDNWTSEVEGRWTIADLRAHENYRDGWISFDSLAWDVDTEKLYIGLTAVSTDIFYEFDSHTCQFRSLNFRQVSDKFDVKFHRSIERDNDGKLYLATALLHDVNEQREAKGGKLLRYDPAPPAYTLLTVPVASNYIQSILLDKKNRIIYGFTYPSEQLFKYDLTTGQVQHLAFIGNGIMICQPHCAVLDTEGRLWGTWGESRAFEFDPGPVPIRIFCYDPKTDGFTWYKHGFPKTSLKDPARVDHMLLGKDGLIYVGTVAGGFSRLDPETGAVESFDKPYEGGRLAGLVQASNGMIYGAGNSGYDADHNGTNRLFRFDPTTLERTDLGAIWDVEAGTGATNIHMLVEGKPGTLYAGENDNIWRSSYLWECKVD